MRSSTESLDADRLTAESCGTLSASPTGWNGRADAIIIGEIVTSVP